MKLFLTSQEFFICIIMIIICLQKKIKNEIKETLKITCSIGVATNKICAKIASKINKPDGITLVPFTREKEFLAGLPIGKIPGVGKSTQERLKRYGIELISDHFEIC